ncbi:flagellin N-terminal helical domain-containing protein [Sphingomonas radiodurans]|uniref:flagellin N-terminal helical domain-containing protein n=1 Tax=Sphingomonas radiodurans TaxID=2890321 RepID=UPI001E41C142|nr:flagellin [Sphingomonas radiodurans]WBH15664.1 flagellin [Sphingomonas radiodurans]
MTVIGSNISSLRASNASAKAQDMLATSMERLSTGKRINSAKDDAAGLAIASSMTSQIRGMNQGIRNANDGISMAQTAEGALDEVSNMLQRMRELQVQKTNGTYSTTDASNITAEQEALAQQIQSVVKNTAFNGKNLFATANNNITIQAGANASDTVTLALPKLDAAYAAGPPAVGELSQIVDFTATGTDPRLATVDLAKFDTAIASVATTRAGLGAAQNRLESAVNNLTSNATNLSDARSRIEDADFSTETTNLAKAQILSQASTAMLSQANQSQQGVLKLLG